MTRRHLEKSQLAAVAVKSLPLLEAEAKERQRLSEGRGQKKGQVDLPDLSKDELLATLDKAVDEFGDAVAHGQARDQAAKTVGVSGKLVSDAKRVQREAPELFQRVEAD